MRLPSSAGTPPPGLLLAQASASTMNSTPTRRIAPFGIGSYISAWGCSAFGTPPSIRDGSTKCTPIAPVSGPLTHGVAGTQPCAIATLMSLNCAVAMRTFSTRGESSDEPAVAAMIGNCRASSRQTTRVIGFLNETFIKIYSSAAVLLEEIWIENANLGDALNGKLAPA